MASHHLHHHPHHHQTQISTAGCCSNSCCCANSYCSQTQHQPADPVLLQAAIASQIFQSSPPSPPYYTTHYPKFSNTHKLHHSRHHFQQHHRKEHSFHQQDEPPSQPPHFLTLSSLLSRIEALESSLHRFPSGYLDYRHPLSLRDVAARTIQTHFRAFLVRRSRTLRQLRDLAIIKSCFNSLKSLLSNDTRINFEALSIKAMDLLLNLDSIQGSDPMIRDGKRSISRDLVRFLELLDVATLKRNGISLKAVKSLRVGQNVNKSRVFSSKNGNLGGDQREMIEKLRKRVEKIRGISRVCKSNEEDDVELEGFCHRSDDEEENPSIVFDGDHDSLQIRNGVLVKRHRIQQIQPKVKKSVTFADKRDISRVFGNNENPIPNGDCVSLEGSDSSDDNGEILEKLCKRVEEIGFSKGDEDNNVEAEIEDRGSPQTSDECIYEIRGQCQGQNGDFVFSAPLPVKMEPKAELVNNRKAVKFVDMKM